VRAADVTLKERRTLVLMVRETPCTRVPRSHEPRRRLRRGHPAADAGLLPPSPRRSWTSSIRVSALDQVGIEHDLFKRWTGHGRKETHELTLGRIPAAKALPQDHLEFFRRLVASHSEGGYRFVHAGIRPGVFLTEQIEHDQMWIRKHFLDLDEDHGAVVIHGHSISPEPQLRHNRVGIDIGAYASGVLTCLVLDGDRRVYLQTNADSL
jgi:hypothetical protein